MSNTVKASQMHSTYIHTLLTQCRYNYNPVFTDEDMESLRNLSPCSRCRTSEPGETQGSLFFRLYYS